MIPVRAATVTGMALSGSTKAEKKLKDTVMGRESSEEVVTEFERYKLPCNHGSY